MCDLDSTRFAEKREVTGSATVGFNASDSHLVQQYMGSRSRLFGGRGHLFGKRKKVYEYNAPTASIWFSIFMLGEKRRIGVARRQDKALTVNQLMLIGDIYEEDWSKSNSEEEKKEPE